MFDTKIIALYLPQFYETDENNRWWGKGFTEWVNLKKAEPLYKGHEQPVIPENNNYYNLLDKHTVIWQTGLAKQYGIYGFAYYHYWFGGKKILEKPAENILKWKDIDQNFFFFWANHTWYKTINGKKEELIVQEYGNVEDWIAHYKYMSDFFKDKRYIKINNAPVLGIYEPANISERDEMYKLWNDMALEDGFDGIYIIESINGLKKREVQKSKYANVCLLRQPNLARQAYLQNVKHFGMRLRRIINRWMQREPKTPYMFRYEEICKNEIRITNDYADGQFFYCIATGWDNTPRHKKYGEVFTGNVSSLYESTFEELYLKSQKNKNEFIFINAWNEWAEGMNLEPDNYKGCELLEATKRVFEKYHSTQ